MKKIFYFGIDIGATFTKMALVDEKCRILAREKVSSRGFFDKAYFTKTIKKVLTTSYRVKASVPLKSKELALDCRGLLILKTELS